MWKSMQVYYYEDDKQALLLDGIRPVLQQMKANGSFVRAYVQRHWRFGPHIAIHVEFEQEEAVEGCFLQIKDRLKAYLSKYPSQRQLDESSYLQLCEQWESECPGVGPLVPLQPDNQVAVVEHNCVSGMWKHPLLSELLRSFYAYTYELVHIEIERTRSNRQARYVQLVRMMASVSMLFPSRGLDAGCSIYKEIASNYVEYMKRSEQKQFIIKQFEEVDGQWGVVFDEAVQEVVQYSSQTGLYEGKDELLRRWSAALKELSSAVMKLTEEGLLQTAEVEELWLEHLYPLSGGITGQFASKAERLLSAVTKLRQDQEEEQCSAMNAYCCLMGVLDGLLPLFHISAHVKHLLAYLMAGSAERVLLANNQYRMQRAELN
ncbi:lantibiotic dehydratase C-terminal domain-containing protein [Paenibacillus agilis]|uniref:Thiopeptide-type bacteriocin biosynthesis domain-containing protein n=1 Tax=Paenibacillus agilis TaxID=3020863 RepID=A0A559IGW4_9BACL|nr:lantibiotic dehydratase C-terminal domain-containing protein [Paenibacillus agilis]TVX86770.1 hypothetical protein FPZ44_22880 [Paenibacillus agilis]